MRASSGSLILFALAALALGPSRALAQGVSVSPNCAASGTHVILSSGGWPFPGNCDACETGFDVEIDNQFVYRFGGIFRECPTSFIVDLDTLSCLNCGIIGLPGQHTVRVTGQYLGGSCGDGASSICTSYTRVFASSVGDPWSLTEPLIAQDTVGAVFRFLPQMPCGFPACDSVQLMQAFRLTAVYPSGRPHFFTFAELFATGSPEDREWADSLDAWSTPAHFVLDCRLGDQTPYMTVRPEYVVAKPGRIGSMPDTARFADAPIMPDTVYPDSVAAFVFDFEVSAFCAHGPGQGQYLGRSVWQVTRPRHLHPDDGFGKVTIQPSGTVERPPSQFIDALDRWVSRNDFVLRKIVPPAKGGSPCE